MEEAIINLKDHVQEFKTKIMPSESHVTIIGIKLTLKNPTKDRLTYKASIELTDKEEFLIAQEAFVSGKTNYIQERLLNTESDLVVQPGETRHFRGSIEFLNSHYQASDEKPVLKLTAWK